MPPRLVHLRDIPAFDYQFGPLQGGRMQDVARNPRCAHFRVMLALPAYGRERRTRVAANRSLR